LENSCSQVFDTRIGGGSVTRKLLSVALSVLIAGLLIESFFILVYRLRDGKFIPAERAYKSIAPREYNLTQLESCTNPHGLAPHPYLGFSHLAKSFCGDQLKGMGHTGSAFPRAKDPRNFTVLLTGASVPKQLLTASPSLTGLLSHYTADGRTIVVLDGTEAAWKQPQQLILLMLSLDRIDAVLTLEGFNELSFNKAYQYDHDFTVPFWPAYRKANLGTLIGFRDHATLLFVENAFVFVDTHPWLKRSRTAFFVLESLRKYTRSTIHDIDTYPVASEVEEVFRLPDDWDYQTRRNYFFASYLRYIRTMHALAASNNIRFDFFLQPVSAVGKPLSDVEQANLKDASYRDDYLDMEKQLLSLSQEHIPVHSLTQVFANHPETLYEDGIHLDPDADGIRILNQAIVDALVADWNLSLEK
jgi:hypothetical protein